MKSPVSCVSASARSKIASTGKRWGPSSRQGDGIARVYGLDSCSYGELVEFESGGVGMALNLDEDDVGCILFSDQDKVREGETVRRTGRVVEVPAGPALFGRVVDPLGVPIDGVGPGGSQAHHAQSSAARLRSSTARASACRFRPASSPLTR